VLLAVVCFLCQYKMILVVVGIVHVDGHEEMTKLVEKIKFKNLTRRIGIEVVIMKKTRSNRDDNASVQGKWFKCVCKLATNMPILLLHTLSLKLELVCHLVFDSNEIVTYVSSLLRKRVIHFGIALSGVEQCDDKQRFS